MISPTPPPSLFTGYASSFFTTPIHPYTLLCQRERDHSSTFVGLSTHKVSALSVSRVVLLLFYILLSVSYVAVLLPRSGAIAHPRGAPRTSTSAHHSATLHTHTSDKKKKKEKNAMTLTRFFPVSSLAMSTSLSLSLSLSLSCTCMHVCVGVLSYSLCVSDSTLVASRGMAAPPPQPRPVQTLVVFSSLLWTLPLLALFGVGRYGPGALQTRTLMCAFVCIHICMYAMLGYPCERERENTREILVRVDDTHTCFDVMPVCLYALYDLVCMCCVTCRRYMGSHGIRRDVIRECFSCGSSCSNCCRANGNCRVHSRRIL